MGFTLAMNQAAVHQVHLGYTSKRPYEAQYYNSPLIA